MKCKICKEKLELNFLKKRMGTVVKDKKGKKHDVCNKCQAKFATKEELLSNI